MCFSGEFFGIISEGSASTFVGNGGSLLDTELRRSLEALRVAIKSAQQNVAPCTCTVASDQCKILDSLNEKQDNFCQTMIKRVSRPLLSLLADEKNVSFRWTTDTIKLGKSSRTFDAVTQRKEKRIILQETRFAQMKEAARVQLLAHELLHLVMIEGEYLEDVGPQGPFGGEEGGRDLLDTLGAAYAALAVDEGLLSRQISKWSHPAKSFFVTTGVAIQGVEPALADAMRVDPELGGGYFGFEWYPYEAGAWGLSLHHRWVGAGKKSSYERRFDWDSYDLGAIYRMRPFDSDNDFLNGIHASLSLGVSQSKVRYRMADGFQKIEQQTLSYGLIGDLVVRLPLRHGFWVYASGGGGWSPFQLDDFHLISRKLYSTQALGVSYGFSF